MAWTTPRTWVASEVVTAAIMNTHVRDNLTDLDARNRLLQTQHAEYGTQTTVAAATWTDTGITQTITPQSASSTLLFEIAICGLSGTVAGDLLQLRLMEDAVSLVVFGNVKLAGTTDDSVCKVYTRNVPSPGTSAVTYKVQFQRGSGTGTVYVQRQNDLSTMRINEWG